MGGRFLWIKQLRHFHNCPAVELKPDSMLNLQHWILDLTMILMVILKELVCFRFSKQLLIRIDFLELDYLRCHYVRRLRKPFCVVRTVTNDGTFFVAERIYKFLP